MTPQFSYNDQLFGQVPNDEPVIVAVSGGSDSIALLLLAQMWALKHNGELHAVTVDHGLRPEAAAEAAYVAGICAQLDIGHATLAWEGVKPSFGLQEAARNSRYELLDSFAREIGASVILTGHTSDDQAETVYMRARRGQSGGDGRGLAGMAPQTRLIGGCRIIRPLLSVSREALRSFLKSVDQSWIEDPSNFDESFERVKIRKILRSNRGLSSKTLRLSAVSSGLRVRLNEDVARFLTKHALMRPGPVFELSGIEGFLDHHDHPVLEQAIQVLIALAGGREFFVSRRRLSSLKGQILEVLQGKQQCDRSVTLGGAVIELKRQANNNRPRTEDRQGEISACHSMKLVFFRENRNLSSLPLEPGEAANWDGRLQVYNGSRWPIYLEPADRLLLRELERCRQKRFPVQPRRALLSTPALLIHNEDKEVLPVLPLVESGSLLNGIEVRIACVAIESFCSQWDESLLQWVKSLDSHASASLQP